MISDKKYLFSFSAGALLGESFDAVIEHTNDFESLVSKEEKIDYSVIPVNSESSQKRYLSEIINRISVIPISILEIYEYSTSQEKKIIQFFAVCKRYTIIAEFMIEIVRNKWLNLDFELDRYDFIVFVQRKLSETEDLNQVTEKTLSKLAQVFFKMLKELGMYSNQKFHKIEISSTLVDMISKSGDEWFLDVMLLTDEEKNKI